MTSHGYNALGWQKKKMIPGIQCMLPTGILEATRAWRLLNTALFAARNAVLEMWRLMRKFSTPSFTTARLSELLPRATGAGGGV